MNYFDLLIILLNLWNLY